MNCFEQLRLIWDCCLSTCEGVVHIIWYVNQSPVQLHVHPYAYPYQIPFCHLTTQVVKVKYKMSVLGILWNPVCRWNGGAASYHAKLIHLTWEGFFIWATLQLCSSWPFLASWLLVRLKIKRVPKKCVTSWNWLEERNGCNTETREKRMEIRERNFQFFILNFLALIWSSE